MKDNKKSKFNLKEAAKKHGWKVALGVSGVGLIALTVVVKKALKDDGDYIKTPWFKDDLTNRNAFLMHWPKSEKVGYDEVIVDFKNGEFNGTFKDLDIPSGFLTAHIDELWQEGDDVLATMHDIDIHDLGKFGEELGEKIPELKDIDFVHLLCVGFTKFNAD